MDPKKAEHGRQAAARVYDEARRFRKLDGKFAGIVLSAYATAMVAQALGEVVEGDESNDPKQVFRAHQEFSELAARALTDEMKRALAVRAYVVSDGFRNSAAEYGLDEDVPGGTGGILTTEVARATFDRTARTLFATVLGRGNALVERDSVRCVVSGVVMVDGIDEDRDDQTYEVTLTTNPHREAPEWGELKIRVFGDAGIARYRFGGEVVVMVAPAEADPAATSIARYRKATEELEDDPMNGGSNTSSERRLAAELEKVTDQGVLAVVRGALSLADDVGSRLR